ncbi:MAG: UPF0280 family protein [Candidatus Omnitrophica bacterium]|nr:UPF0280 family protein [Candidatus Omnitrophota bacterium]
MILSLTQDNKRYLYPYKVKIKESSLFIYSSNRSLLEAKSYLSAARKQIEAYAGSRPEFSENFKPLKLDPLAPAIIKAMLKAAEAAKVGPMAAVAGAIAEYVGRKLLKDNPEVIVDNGGDIFLKLERRSAVGILAGKSPLSNKLAIILPRSKTPWGICTSSGTIGHSFSYGKSDATVIVAKNCALADAWATSAANMVKKASDIDKVIRLIKKEKRISGAVIIKGKKLAVTGNIEIETMHPRIM